MLSSSLKLSLAVLTTLMDLFVVGRYAGVLWFVWGPNPFARVGLLILAGGITFTLVDIWSQAVYALGHLMGRFAQADQRKLYLGQSAGMESADV